MSEESWRDMVCTNKKKREESAFISPNGDWYNVPYASHARFAAEVISEIYNSVGDESDLVDKHGWIQVHRSHPATLILGTNMTFRQYTVLKEYFGDEKLAYGHTIDGMYFSREGLIPQVFKEAMP